MIATAMIQTLPSHDSGKPEIQLSSLEDPAFPLMAMIMVTFTDCWNTERSADHDYEDRLLSP